MAARHLLSTDRIDLLSAGFRPFFLGAAIWAALALPIWLALLSGAVELPTALPPLVWHVHEMVFGYGAAAVAGFLLTAIPNWTGRLPLRGRPLLGLVLLWAAGRIAVLGSAGIGARAATVADLAFPAAFLAVAAREIIAGRNWRNLPITVALSLLVFGNALVHAEALGVAPTGEFGNRIGVATLLMLIALVGGRIVPSFTRNWLVRNRPDAAVPAPFGAIDLAALAIGAIALAAWAIIPDWKSASVLELVAGIALAWRLARWRGLSTLSEPLLWVLHLGYFWLALGFVLTGAAGFLPLLPQTTALHAWTVGAIATMTLAVMTRASLGHTGRALTASPATTVIYCLITAAALLRLLAPFAGAEYMLLIELAGTAWSGAFILYAIVYWPVLTAPPRRRHERNSSEFS